MMNFINLLALLIVLVACSSSMPKRDFKVTLYKTDAVCVKYVTEDDEVVIICDDDERFPKDLVGITIKDYNLERGYQDLLKKKCKKWRR